MTKINKKLFQSVGSSETIRKTPVSFSYSLLKISLINSVYTQPFDFTDVENLCPQQIEKYSPEFLAWFLGFSEGDGGLIVSDNRLFFTITQKDAACLNRLRTQLGFGTICNDKEHAEIKRFTVTHRDHIKILIKIFNGNLLLKKTNLRFARWLNHYNQLTGESIELKSRWNNRLETSLISVEEKTKLICHSSSKNIEDQSSSMNSREYIDSQTLQNIQKTSVIWNSGWLSGFLEAEGLVNFVDRCFSAMIRRQGYYLRFILDQTDELELFIHIRLILNNVGSIWIRKTTEDKDTSTLSHKHYRYETSTLSVLDQLIGYIKRYPLRTKKNVTFIRWKKLFSLVALIKQEKEMGTYIWSEKRDKRMVGLLDEIKRSDKERKFIKEAREKFEKQVEDRVQL